MRRTLPILLVTLIGSAGGIRGEGVPHLNVEHVSEVVICRIPAELQFPVATSVADFDRRVVFEVRCAKPYFSAFGTEAVHAFNQLKWKPAEEGAGDLRWAVCIKTIGGKSPIWIYMEESGNVYVFDGKAYSGCEELLGTLRKTLEKLR